MRKRPSTPFAQARVSVFSKSAVVGECLEERLALTGQPDSLHRYLQHEPQILIVCANGALCRMLMTILEKAQLSVESVTAMDEGCALAGSGRFEVVLSQPHLPDGSWKRLTDLAARDCSEFVVILLAKQFDMHQWLRALPDGAFDVIDVLYGFDAIEETVQYALWVGYLSGIGPAPDSACWPQGGNR